MANEYPRGINWKNKEEVAQYHRTHASAWNKTHPEERKITKHRHIMKARYGLTPYQYEVLMLCQGGACGICGEQLEVEGGLHVDHNHETGEVRGFLCGPCNMGLGKIGESNLFRAVAYLGGE